MKSQTIATTRVAAWPELFLMSLPAADRRKIKPQLKAKLKRANFYLWQALNIYDDFLDGEAQPQNLPRANAYYRRFLEIYYRLNLAPKFYQLCNRVLTDLDRANRQEVKQKKLKIKNGRLILARRLPHWSNLSILSRKSLALGLGPIAILFILGGNDSKITAGLNFFRYALAAKQLADDAYDWLSDLKNGAITAANVLVLRAAQKRRLLLDLNKKPEIICYLFATQAAGIIAKNIKHLCGQAKKEILKINKNTPAPLIREVITPLEKTAAKTIRLLKSLTIAS